MSNASRPRGGTLTSTEILVIRAIANHGDQTVAARSLGLSRMTIKTHLSHVYAKLGVDSAAQAIGVCVAAGVLRSESLSAGEVSIDAVRAANICWLTIEEQIKVRAQMGKGGVKSPETTTPRVRSGLIELNGLCTVHLTGITMTHRNTTHPGEVHVTLTGLMGQLNARLSEHLNNPWLTRVDVEDMVVRTGQRVNVMVVTQEKAIKGAKRLKVTVSWTERRTRAQQVRAGG